MDSLSKKWNTPSSFADDSSSSDENGEFSYKGFVSRPKRKRRHDAGRRYVRGLTYDSSLGITCHFCRQKTTRKHVYCRECVLALCGSCLGNRHGEELAIEVADDNWLCPKCRGGCGRGCKNCCNCTFCRKKLGLKPPKFAARELHAHGFDNVHDYLIHLETGESAEVISSRKAGKGWCSSYEKKHPSLQKDSQQKKREPSKSPLDESNTCRKGIDVHYEEKPLRRPVPSKEEHERDRADRHSKKSMGGVDEDGAYSKSTSQSKVKSSIPEQFRPKNKFEEKLQAKLAEPFDAEELKKLWAAITCRKSECKNIETSPGTSDFTAKELRHSYIHHHLDLAQKYTATGELEVKLKLLRGFFFWLEYGSMVGSFKPWIENSIDEDCIEMNGPDCQVLGELLDLNKEQQKPDPFQDEDCGEEDIKPAINKSCVHGLPKFRSQATFNWDEEDVKPNVEKLTDWRSSTQLRAGIP